ncbi:MAG: hypothetical protein V1813_00745, partial [Candidatus Aenigmatarchaeota archaeon]
EEVVLKPGKIGIKVKIMTEFRDITGATVKWSYKDAEDTSERKEKHADGGDFVSGDGTLDFNYTEAAAPAAAPAEVPAESSETIKGGKLKDKKVEK